MMDLDHEPPQPKVSLLVYLQQRGWKIVRRNSRGDEVAGLCPLHCEQHPSFYVNLRKQVFYCHGCGCGGGLARLIYLLDDYPDPANDYATAPSLLELTYAFYQRQLPHSEPGLTYLAVRGIHDRAVIQRMRIGYAPGACLRRYLVGRGYRFRDVIASGLVDENGRDGFFRCLTFPLPQAGTMYARSLYNGIYRHRFLPGSKGGLYGWAQRWGSPRVLLVEGLFDVAALWQAGFDDAVAVLGSHLNQFQMVELCQPGAPAIYICFDADRNGSGQRAARALSIQLRHAGLEARRVDLPRGYDPASFFAAGAGPADFQRCLDQARP